MLSESLTCLSKEGAGNPWFPPGVTGGVPLFWKTLEGGQAGQRHRPNQTLR